MSFVFHPSQISDHLMQLRLITEERDGEILKIKRLYYGIKLEDG
jgi:hypothetical protein